MNSLFRALGRIVAFACLSVATLGSGLAASIYVTDVGDATVKVFDQYTGAYQGTWGTGFLLYPTGVAVDTSNNLFVADYSRGEVFRFNASNGAYEGEFGTGFLNGPYGVAVDSNDVVYVANPGGNNVVRFNGLTGAYMGAVASGYCQLPVGVTIGQYNELFVSDYNGGKVFRFDSQSGLYEGYVANGFATHPGAVCVDPYGVLDVFDDGAGQALKFNSQAGSYLGDFAAGYGSSSFGLAIDQNRVVYVTSTSGAVDMFSNLTGGYMGRIGVGDLHTPFSVAVTPQPVLVLPTGYSIFRGVQVAGSLSSLYAVDANTLNVLTGFTLSPSEAPIQVIVTGTSPTANPVSLSFNVTAKMNTPGITQTVSLYNFATSSYVVVDSRAVGTAYTTVTVSATGTLSNFVSSAGLVQARVAYKQTGFTTTSRWETFIDQTTWSIQSNF